MLGGPPHLLEDIGRFGGAPASSHQPVTAISRRPENESMPPKNTERLPDVVAANVRDVAADHHYRPWRQSHRRAAHRPPHPLAQVSATLGAKLHASQ
jgi:hypothetical protein